MIFLYLMKVQLLSRQHLAKNLPTTESESNHQIGLAQVNRRQGDWTINTLSSKQIYVFASAISNQTCVAILHLGDAQDP